MASLTRLSSQSKVEGNFNKENDKNVADLKSKSKSRKSEVSKDTQNEKAVKKGGRKTGTREPLKPLNTFEEEPRYLEIPQPKPVARKSTKPSRSPTNGKKEGQVVQKIIIYEDARTEIYTVTKAEDGKKVGQRLSRSSEKAKPKESLVQERPKSEEKRKTRSSVAAVKPKCHCSMNDILGMDEKKERKSVTAKPVKKKTPSKPKPEKKVAAETSQQPAKLPENHLDEMTATLESMFPNVDPDYLRSQCAQKQGSLQETIDDLVIKEKMDQLPTKADYLRKLESVNLQDKYTTDFSVEGFLKVIPDPWEYFLKVEKHNCPRYAEHSLYYLKNKFKKHYAQIIHDSLVKNEYSLYLTHKELNKKNQNLKMRATNRSKYECDANKPTKFDLQFLQEVAFIENEKEIKAYIKKTEAGKFKRFREAQKSKALFECDFCSRSNLFWDEVVNCSARHVFCKDCVTKKVETEMRNENFDLKCLLKCDERFTIENLQPILGPEMTATVIRRIQLEEIKPAGIEDLVYCPFCYYVTIMSPEMTVLKCLNLSCMKETCRYCKQMNHIPLKCNELEKFEMDKTVIENEEIDKTHPICYHCKKEFVKEEDSNKMVCPCGATICYICRQPFPDCTHFEGNDHNQRRSNISVQLPDLSTTLQVEDFLEGRHDLSASSDSAASDAPTEISQDLVFTQSRFF